MCVCVCVCVQTLVNFYFGDSMQPSLLQCSFPCRSEHWGHWSSNAPGASYHHAGHSTHQRPHFRSIKSRSISYRRENKHGWYASGWEQALHHLPDGADFLHALKTFTAALISRQTFPSSASLVSLLFHVFDNKTKQWEGYLCSLGFATLVQHFLAVFPSQLRDCTVGACGWPYDFALLISFENHNS